MDYSTVIANNETNNINDYKEVNSMDNVNNDNNMNMKNENINHSNEIFHPFNNKFKEIYDFLRETQKNEFDEIDENLIKTLYKLCEEFLNSIKNINQYGKLSINENDRAVLLDAYDKFVHQCKDYNNSNKVKELENEISNLLDLLFSNTSEAVNTLFLANSFFMSHIENLKLRLNERNQKIQFENERVKKLNLEKQIEQLDSNFEENKNKNQELDESIKNVNDEINQMKKKIEKYNNYMKKKREEIDIDFSESNNCKERIKILEENIKSLERNIKSTQLSPLKIIEQTSNLIIFEFDTPRNIMHIKVKNYELENVEVVINPYDENILAYINENIKNCTDVSEISYLIKEAIYLNFLDI